LIDKITNFQSSFKEKEYILEKSINLKRTIDDIYSRNEKRVMLFLNIIENLENRKPVFNDFISFYHDVFEYVVKNSEKNDLDEIFLDKKFGVYLLDPVQLICSSEHVSKPYERRMIEKYTKDGGTCPVCDTNLQSATRLIFNKYQIKSINCFGYLSTY
jgi:hypothetical protein